MKLTAWLAVRRGLVILPLVVVAATACKKTRPTVVTQADVLQAADQSYEVSRNERPPKDTVDPKFPPNHSVPDDSAPELKIATMTLIGPPPVNFKILARIRSDKPFRPMGIESGYNYLWRKLGDSTVWITPLKAGASNHQLFAVPGYVFKVQPGHEPSLFRVKVNSLAFVACLDDCPSGHCGMF